MRSSYRIGAKESEWHGRRAIHGNEAEVEFDKLGIDLNELYAALTLGTTGIHPNQRSSTRTSAIASDLRHAIVWSARPGPTHVQLAKFGWPSASLAMTSVMAGCTR